MSGHHHVKPHVSSAPPASELASTLEDTQASLNAALAHLEIYRKKNKALTKEVTDLRELAPSAAAAVSHVSAFVGADAAPGRDASDDGEAKVGADAAGPSTAQQEAAGGGNRTATAASTAAEGDETPPMPLPPRAPGSIAVTSARESRDPAAAREALVAGSPVSARNLLRRMTTMKRTSSSGSLQKSPSQSSLKGQVPTQQPLFFYHGEQKVKGFVFAREGCLEFYELKATITPPQFVGVAAVDDPAMRSVADDIDIPVEHSQQWFDMGWLFHPQDVISNLSHYLAETIIGDEEQASGDEGDLAFDPATMPGGVPAAADVSSWAAEPGKQQLRHQEGSGSDAARSGGPTDGCGQDGPSAASAAPPRVSGNAAGESSGGGGTTAGSATRESAGAPSQECGGDVDFSRWDLPVGRKGGHSETWELLWKEKEGEGRLQRMVFEGSTAACAFIHKQVESWHLAPSNPEKLIAGGGGAGGRRSSSAGASAAAVAAAKEREAAAAAVRKAAELAEASGVDQPLHLVPGQLMPQLSMPSQLLSDKQVRALVTALPNRYRMSDWRLVYSTQRHGISLQTLYRNAHGVSPTILVLRDTGGYLFGAFCSEAWHVGPRYYGTGETFVFQLQPHMVAWHWHRKVDSPNSFFLYGCHDSLAVGGGSDFALWIDGELDKGHSGACDTFGSPSLSAAEDFTIGHIELWTPV